MSSSIISAYGQYNHLEMDEVMKNLCDENVNLKSALAKQESQKTTQHREMTRQIRSLENDVAKLTAAKNLLERDLHQIAPLRSKLPRSFSSFSRLKDLDPAHVIIPPPPTHPPSEPIPPLPQEENKKQRLSRDDLQAQVDRQHQEIQNLLDSHASLKTTLKETQAELLEEKKKTLHERKTREILDKRMQELMNKKNKFLCF